MSGEEKAHQIEEEIECAICLQGMDQLTEAGLDTCRHSFHIDCISKWARQSSTCPLCKGKFENIVFQGGKISITLENNFSDEDSLLSSDEDPSSDYSVDRETDEEQMFEDDNEYRCSICGVDDDLMGRRLFCSCHCGSYAHAFCLGPATASSNSSSSSWMCIDCAARQQRAVSRQQSRRREAWGHNSRILPPVPIVPQFLSAETSSAVRSNTQRPPDLSIHWAEREISLQMQKLAAQRKKAGSLMPLNFSNDRATRERKRFSSSLATDIARELDQEDERSRIKRDDSGADGTGVTSSYKRPRRRQDHLASSGQACIPYPQVSVAAPTPLPTTNTESSFASKSATGDVLMRALMGTHATRPISTSEMFGKNFGASTISSPSMLSTSSTISPSAGYQRVCSATSRSYDCMSDRVPKPLSTESLGYNGTKPDSTTSPLGSNSAATCVSSASSLHITATLSSRVNSFMTPLWDALQVSSYQPSPGPTGTYKGQDLSTRQRDAIIDISISSMIPKLFSLCTYHDTSFLSGLLDAGILNLIDQYISQLLKSVSTEEMANCQQIEIILRVANWLPIRAKHVIVIKRNEASGGTKSTTAQFRPFVRTLLRIMKKSQDDINLSHKLYVVTQNVIQNIIGTLHRFPNAKTKLESAIKK